MAKFMQISLECGLHLELVGYNSRIEVRFNDSLAER